MVVSFSYQKNLAPCKRVSRICIIIISSLFPCVLESSRDDQAYPKINKSVAHSKSASLKTKKLSMTDEFSLISAGIHN